jgi:hypothetical protein
VVIFGPRIVGWCKCARRAGNRLGPKVLFITIVIRSNSLEIVLDRPTPILQEGS